MLNEVVEDLEQGKGAGCPANDGVGDGSGDGTSESRGGDEGKGDGSSSFRAKLAASFGGAGKVRPDCKRIFSHDFFNSNFYSVIVTFVTIIGEGERRIRETWCGRRYGQNRGDKEAENRRRGVRRDEGKYKKGQNFSLPKRLFMS